MRFNLLIIFCFLCSTSYGQTKFISFKSHSGNNRNFRAAVENNLFDIGNSNFGIVSTSVNKIDTVVKKNNKLIIFKSVTKKINGRISNTFFKRDTLNLEQSKSFLNIKNIDSLKKELKKKYIGYAMDDLKFINLDEKNKMRKK